MLIFQDRRVDPATTDVESVASDFALHRRQSRSLGLGGLVDRVAQAMIPSLKQASPELGHYGARLVVRDATVAPLTVKQNPSRYESIRNETDPIGVSREFLGAYQLIQSQNSVAPYARIDSLEAGWEYRVEVTDYELVVPSLPHEADGICIVQLSDLHIGRFVRAEDVRQVARFVSVLHPSLIVMTGDHVFQQQSAAEFERALRHIRDLAPALGIYATLGNHDYWEGAGNVREALHASGITVLDNENRELMPGLRLAAIDDMLAGQPDLDAALRDIPHDVFTLLLSHNPNVLPQAAGRSMVIFSGHTHGAQLKFAWQDFASTTHPDLYAHLSTAFETVGYVKRGGNADGLGCWRYMDGWYEAGMARMYVNRGLGMVRPPYRVNCPAEVAAFHLRRGIP